MPAHMIVDCAFEALGGTGKPIGIVNNACWPNYTDEKQPIMPSLKLDIFKASFDYLLHVEESYDILYC